MAAKKEVKISKPLQEVQTIIESRPDLTEKEWPIVEKASPWIKAQLYPEVRAELEIEIAGRFETEIAKIRKENQEAVNVSMKEWKENQEPLSPEELQKLLTQEYLSFDVKIMSRAKKGSKPAVKDFVLIELPQEVERRFVALAQKHLLPLIERANAAEWKMTTNMSEQLQMLLDNLPSAMDVASDLCALCLDPWQEDKEVTPEWVRQNISTHRLVKILMGQMEVNKYRDFFSGDYRLFRMSKRT